MKLTDAIRLGATLHPQIRGAFFCYKDGQIAGTCALASAAVAAGCSESSEFDNFMADSFPECRLPVKYRGLDSTVSCVVVDLNDGFRLTREQIADYIDAMPELQAYYANQEQPEEELVAA